MIELPGLGTFQGTPEQEVFLAARGRFVTQYCLSQNWDRDNLTIKQILEVRNQEGWKNPDLQS